jgi:hypothetical protein
VPGDAGSTITVSTSGQLTVAAPGKSRSKRHDRGAQPPSGSGGGAHQQPGTGGGRPPGAGSSTSHRPAVVAAQVPNGSDSWASIGPPPLTLDTTDRSALERPGLPQVAAGGNRGAGTATGNPPLPAGLGLPAIVAVALLSAVTAALVRALIIQRRAVLL